MFSLIYIYIRYLDRIFQIESSVLIFTTGNNLLFIYTDNVAFTSLLYGDLLSGLTTIRPA